MLYDDSIVREASSSLEGCNDVQTAFLQWFRAFGGWLNPQCRFVDYAKLGTGLGAAEDIENDALLFSIPRNMLLNVNNSQLPTFAKVYDELNASSLQPQSAWDDVNVGWNGLIMTMMWERFRSSEEGARAWQELLEETKVSEWIQQSERTLMAGDSNDQTQAKAALEARTARVQWGPYLDVLPQSFDTPMFWTPEELEELQGTAILDKVGKEEASQEYADTVRPYIESHPHLFFGSFANRLAAGGEAERRSALNALIDKYYSLEQFHTMGSRVLSRSFHVKGDQGIGEGQVDGVKNAAAGEQEEASEHEGSSDEEDDDDDDDDEGSESIHHVSMVPMADMLNARFGHDNARLFYKRDVLEMRSTRLIEAGQQIWNTYGEPPSSDLLRRYGYVDLCNPADVVEITIDDLINARVALQGDRSGADKDDSLRQSLLGRIEWACAMGVDEVSPLMYPFPPSPEAPFERPMIQAISRAENRHLLRQVAADLPDDLLVLSRLLCWSDEAFERAQQKDKLPSPRVDARDEETGMAVTQVVLHAIAAHRQTYKTTLEHDEALIQANESQGRSMLSLNRFHAVLVRMSEKRILNDNETLINAIEESIKSSKRGQDQQGRQVHTKKVRR